MRNQLIFLAILAACGNGGGGKTASVELFGSKPVPPGDLTKITPTMTQAEFKAAFPKAYKTPNQSGSPSLSIDSGYGNLKYKVGFYSDIDKVSSITLEVPKDLAGKLESAWGKPTTKGTFGGPGWRNEEDGYVAEVMEMGRRTEIRFQLFTPLSPAYFGTQPGPFDELAKLKLGMTREEVKAATPTLDFPPKGGGAYIPNDGKADGVQLELRFASDDAGKLEAFEIKMPKKGVEMLATAWGAPKVGKIRGDARPCHLWRSADGSMQIELSPEGRDSMSRDGRPMSVVDVTIAAPDRSFCEAP